MKVRRPNFDFSETPAKWSPNAEFAQFVNSNSLWIPELERFLNRVMAKAAAEIKDEDEETRRLKSDIQIFVRQEAQHTAIHAAFNASLARDGYDVEPFYRLFKEEFDKLLETKSLAFLCAYCEGFETFGPPGAISWLDEMDDVVEGARPEVVNFWKWHLMEEYEHRTVCHRVFNKIHGGYFLRIYALFYQLFQTQGFSVKVRKHLFERDRANMAEEELKASKKRVRQLVWQGISRTLPRVLSKALSPFYDPAKAKEPRRYRAYMAQVEAEML